MFADVNRQTVLIGKICVRRYGFFKNKRIVLYDTLIEQCKEPEVVAVLAHELGMPLICF